MNRKEAIKKWNSYFGGYLKRGYSWSQIRQTLISRHGYKASLIEPLIYNFKEEKARRQKLIVGAAASLLLIFLALPFFIKPTILGMILGGGTNTDYLGFGNGVNIVFVDKNNPNCNNAYTRAQALNGLTPWCGLEAPLTNNKLLSGDTLYIGAGEYNGESTLVTRSITNNITISAYPGDEVILTRYYLGGQASAPNALWTETSMNGETIWYTTLTSSSTSHPRVYHENATKFFTWTNFNNFIASDYPENSWYNSTSKRLQIKFSDQAKNPNQIPIFIASEYQPLYIRNNAMSTGAYIIIRNITFKYIFYSMQLSNQSNVIVENCEIMGGHFGIYVNGHDVSANRNLIFRNNYFDGKQNPVWYGEDMKNEGTEETSGLKVNDFAGRIEVYNNDFVYWHGGILLSTNSAIECNNSEIYNNTFQYGRGSQIEIEDYCSNTKYHHNTIIDSGYAGVSFAPANADSGLCNFSYNIIVAKGQLRWSPTTGNDYNWAIKAQSRSIGNNVSNWVIDHNTFYGYGRALNSMEMEGAGTTAGTWSKTNWTNNIFYAEKEYALLRTGLTSNKVFYDNNLYYLKPGGTKLLQRWNNNNAVGYSTLAAAKASSDWDGKWDVHSKEADPLFTNLANNDLTPKTGSPACTMSSTGSYVGAIPCEGTQPPLTPFCGDGTCNNNENCSTCSNDCGSCPIVPYCGDGSCNGNENCSTCNQDCGSCPVIPYCGDGTCNNNENCSTCSSDCSSCPIIPYCGDDACNGNENCTTCSADCGSCPVNPFCGNLTCNNNENCSTCNQDCGSCPVIPYCGDSSCNGAENCSTCTADCGTCPEQQQPSQPSRGGGGGGGGSKTVLPKNETSSAKGNVAGKATSIMNSSTETNQNVKQNIGEENNEATPISKEPSQEAPGGIAFFSKEKENSSWLVFALTLLAISIIGLIMTFKKLYPKQKKPFIVQEREVKEAQKPQALNISGSQNNIEDLAKLHKYAREATKRGYTRERVENELLTVGWEKGLVHNLMIMHDSEFLGGEVAEFKLNQSQNVVSDSFIQNEAMPLKEGTFQVNEDVHVKDAQTQPKGISSSMKNWMEYERIDASEGLEHKSEENEGINRANY
jgi:hypothetical protein